MSNNLQIVKYKNKLALTKEYLLTALSAELNFIKDNHDDMDAVLDHANDASSLVDTLLLINSTYENLLAPCSD